MVNDMNTRWGNDDERWQVMEDLTADLNAGHTCITSFSGYGTCAACDGHTCVSSLPEDDRDCEACEAQAIADAAELREEEEDEARADGLYLFDDLGSNIARAERRLMIAAGALVVLIAVWMWWA